MTSSSSTSTSNVLDNFDVEEIKRKKSIIWDHFTHDKILHKATCNHCFKVFVYNKSGTTSALNKHYKIFHTKPLKDENQNIQKYLNPKYDDKHYLLKWMVECNISFKALNSLNFKRFQLARSTTMQIYTSDIMKKYLDEVYIETSKQIKLKLSQVCSQLNYTIDIWSSPIGVPFLALTCHFINDKWELENILVDCHPFIDKHSGENICDVFLTILNNNGISLNDCSITLDNARNNVSFIEVLSSKYPSLNIVGVRCMRHIINLAAKQVMENVDLNLIKLRTLIKIARQPKNISRLKTICKEFDPPINYIKVKLDMAVRWNSTYIMIEKAILMRQALDDLAFKFYKEELLSNVEWEEIERLKFLLFPFYSATNLISGEQYPTMNLVLPVYYQLIETLTTVEDHAVKMAKQKIEKYIAFNKKIALLASVVDPRLKIQYFECLSPIHDISYSEIKADLEAAIGRNQLDFVPTSEVSALDRLFKSDMNAKSPLETYLNEPRVASNVEPLQWWKSNQLRFPAIQKIAKNLLSIPGSSTPCERIFSTGTNLLTKHKQSFKEESVRKIICLKNWLKNIC